MSDIIGISALVMFFSTLFYIAIVVVKTDEPESIREFIHIAKSDISSNKLTVFGKLVVAICYIPITLGFLVVHIILLVCFTFIKLIIKEDD